uniref:Uncharacterized protein n=1 Tax=Pogona vitticeps TaxID=103695 RepID=A0ABM5FID9_9SAUR
MPKRKSVHSLQELCLENVASNLDHIWIKEHTDCLAGFLVQELLQFLGNRKLLTSDLLCSLLVPQLKTLDWSICPELVTRAVVTTVPCKNLSSLILQDCNQIPADALLDLVKALPHLIKLNLSATQCNTQVLSAATSSCRQLRELDISGCQRLSPYSLLHLAYNPSTGSFCCSGLQILVMEPLNPRIDAEELVWALVFLLLALPSLKCLVHEQVTEAVCLIYHQLFDGVQVPPVFPSLVALARRRMPAFPGKGPPGFVLALKSIHDLSESSWPMVRAVCPYVRNVSVTLTGMPPLGESFLSACHIVHLTVGCREERDMREVLFLTQSLQAQLECLSVSNFAFEDEWTFHVLLSHCVNLQKLTIRFLSPVTSRYGRRTNVEALKWDFALPPHPFPYLCDVCLVHSDIENHLPSQHARLLKDCLESLLRHSPCLEILELVSLPFPLDEVFEKLLRPPGRALAQLRRLSLVEDDVSLHAIHLLLSSENQLSYLNVDTCPKIDEREYQELCQRVGKEGLDVEILWA